MKSRTWEVGVLALCALLLLACVCVSASAEGEMNTVEVSTVDEFLSAIAPNTEIVMAAGEYDLTTYSSYSSSYGDGYCYWDGVYDGYELVISGVDNLSITAAEGAEVTISVEPRYANVLSFRDVSNVTISGLTIGHTKKQGSCSGGVLYFENAQDVEIQDTRLYGCGTLGITMYNTQNVHVDGTEIYECSYGIAELNACENVLFENCSFHDCNIILEGFSVRSSQYVALINSEIYDNTSDFSTVLFYLDGPDVYVGGLDVRDNEVAYIFQSSAIPATVESCSFSGMDGIQWYTGQAPLGADGAELTEAELSEMELAAVTWEAPNLESSDYEVTQPTVTAGEDGIIHVSTVNEFLAAIGNNAFIELEAGEYDLSTASGYGGVGGENYYWQSVNDGYELVISGVENLTITGSSGMETTISTEPRYANVLSFSDVSGVTISDVIVGHTEEQGYCTGGVLYFEDCQDVEIQDAWLYGCGTLGVSLNDCGDVHVDGTNIYSCSYGCIDVYRCENVLFENGSFYDCEIVGSGFAIIYSLDVAIINSEIFSNFLSEDMSGSLFYIDSAEVYLGGLDIYDNTVDYIFNLTSDMYTQVTVESCRFRGLGSAEWSMDGTMPVAENGMELSDVDLREMELAVVTWQATPAETAEVTASEDGKIHVSNVDEFLAALAPDVTIYMEPGEYNLTEAASYGQEGCSAYYYWSSVYDGYELIIEHASNLTIEAASPDEVTIVTEPRYANVLNFNNIFGVILRNVKVGHTQEPGECSGGVIQLQSAYNAIVEGCKLYGCGTLGVTAYDCSNLGVYNCEIYECSYGAVFLVSCSTARIEECDIHDVGQSEITLSTDCLDVTVDGQLMEPEY